MRILGITETCDLGSLYMRLIGNGHDVRVTISEPLAAGTMAGMVPRVADWRAELGWIRAAGKEGLLLFEAVGFGALQDELRLAGFNVIGGSALGDRLENDRHFAQRVLARHGLQIARVAEFASGDAARADIEARPRRCVFKASASAGNTWVGDMTDGSDIAALLTGHPPPPGVRFILMDHVQGIEVGVGAYFDGQRFLRPACLDWEHKRFFAGDMGELTGEMGTVATFVRSDRIFEKVLAPLEPLFCEARHIGYINVNTIINEQGIWPLEFTCRFGYPGFAVLEPLQASNWAELFQRMMVPGESPLEVCHGYSLCLVLTTPPFPWSRKELDVPVGLPVCTGNIDPAHLHLGEVGLHDQRLVTSGLYGWTAVVTGHGATISEAKTAAYDRARVFQAPNLRYRLDIGDRLIAGDLDQLEAWGWLNSEP